MNERKHRKSLFAAVLGLTGVVGASGAACSSGSSGAATGSTSSTSSTSSTATGTSSGSMSTGPSGGSSSLSSLPLASSNVSASPSSSSSASGGESSSGVPEGGSPGADASGGGDGGSTDCPANATFCSGFEDPGLPTGAVYMVNAAPGDWSRDFAIDTTQHHSGSSSLLVKATNAAGTSGSSYVMLAVPATPNAFWVRFWVESAMAMGGTDPHNAFAGGSTDDTPNGTMIEFAEDVGIAFNTKDSDVWPTGYGRITGGGTMPYTIPAMTWACVEISYNGTGQEQQLYINGTQLIDAMGYPSMSLALTYFKFGFDGYNGPPRQMWYDDVAVAPTRIGGCD